MRRIATIAVGLGLGVATTTGLAAAQDLGTVENPTVTSDGDYVVATDDPGGNNNVSGEGTNIVVGDVATGNTNGGVLGDPNAIYYPDLSAVPSVTGEAHTPTIVGLPIGNPNSGDLIPGIDVVFTTELAPAPEPAPAPVAAEATTDATTTTESVPAEGEAAAGEPVDDQAGVPVE